MLQGDGPVGGRLGGGASNDIVVFAGFSTRTLSKDAVFTITISPSSFDRLQPRSWMIGSTSSVGKFNRLASCEILMDL